MDRIKELNDWLIARNKEYEEGYPTVSDAEYDSKYFQLVKLEQETGIYRDDSITQQINYQVVNSLTKVKHNHKMLSLAKTKSIDDITKFCKIKDTVAMLKMDGLTLSLKYEKGRLVSAETRGNGIEGEDVLHNALAVSSIPKRIDFEDDLIVDGEIICRYDIFNELNENNTYSNPRNYAAGSIRLLNSEESRDRALTFVAWDAFYEWKLEDKDYYYSEDWLFNKLTDLTDWGFTVVPFIQLASHLSTSKTIEETIENLKIKAREYNYPIDGIVFKYEDKQFGDSLGSTDHHFNNAIAYKFYDEVYKTKLLDIIYDVGRTGVLTPVAVFEEVEIDGAIISKANLSNISIMNEMLSIPYVGQSIEIFRSNMVIPQIYDADKNLPEEAEIINIPQTCPICGGPTKIRKDNESEVLICDNPDCQGKLITQFDYFCSKNGLDIKGLSKATLEKLIDWEWVNNRIDILLLVRHRDEWIKKPGFGTASVDKILNAIDVAMDTTLEKFISSLGIPLVGKVVAKDLTKYFDSYVSFREAVMDDTFSFEKFDGFGEAMNNSLKNYDYSEADEIYHYLTFQENENTETSNSCENLKFCITGSLSHYKKRDDLIKVINSLGGTVVSSVSKNTSYLINNNLKSTTGKSKAAQDLNIPIISEEDFIEKFLKNS